MGCMTWNPVADAEGYIDRMERKLERYPTCSQCGEHIQTGIKLADGSIVCDDCWSYEDFEPEEE